MTSNVFSQHFASRFPKLRSSKTALIYQRYTRNRYTSDELFKKMNPDLEIKKNLKKIKSKFK